MKVFEQRQEDGSRKLMGTPTNDIESAVEVTLKGSDGSTSTFDFSKKYHYVAPGSFAVTPSEEESGEQDEVVLNMYIGDLRVVPPVPHYDYEDTEDSDEESGEEK